MSQQSGNGRAEGRMHVDHEQQVQTVLARALCDSIRARRPMEEIREILARLATYSEAHFMSEQLLMRLYSYPDYDDHVLDHDRMMSALGLIRAGFESGDLDLALASAEELSAFLAGHVASRDRRFSRYLDDLRKFGEPGASGA